MLKKIVDHPKIQSTIAQDKYISFYEQIVPHKGTFI
jgi:hypothetical protein